MGAITDRTVITDIIINIILILCFVLLRVFVSCVFCVPAQFEISASVLSTAFKCTVSSLLDLY